MLRAHSWIMRGGCWGGGALVAGGNSNSNGPHSQRRSKVWCGYSNYVEMGRRGVMGHNGRSFHGAKYP